MKYAITGGTIVTALGSVDRTIVIEEGQIIALEMPGTIVNAMPFFDATGYHILPGIIDLNSGYEEYFLGFKNSDTYDDIQKQHVRNGITTLSKRMINNEMILHNEMIDFTYRSEMNIDELTPERALQLLSLGVNQWVVYCKDLDKMWGCNWQKIQSIIINSGVLIWLKYVPEKIIHKNIRDLQKENSLNNRYYSDIFRNVDQKAFIKQVILICSTYTMELGVVEIIQSDALKLLHEARKQNISIKLNVSLPYFLYSNSVYTEEEAALYFCNPSLPSIADQHSLWEALENGTITTVSTYYTGLNEKVRNRLLPINPDWYGVKSKKTFLELLKRENKGKSLSLSEFVKITSFNPARLLGCYPQKGTINPGSDADFIMIRDVINELCEPDYIFIRGECIKHYATITLREGFGQPVQLARTKRFTC